MTAKNGVVEKSDFKNAPVDSFTQTSKNFFYHSSLGHNNITFSLPAKKGKKGHLIKGYDTMKSLIRIGP